MSTFRVWAHMAMRCHPAKRVMLFALLATIAAAPVVALDASRASAQTVITCAQDWRPATTPPPTPPPSPEHQPYDVWCGGRFVATVWRPARVSWDEAVRFANEVVARIPFPTVRLGVNPARGITGLSSWFWATPEAMLVRLTSGNGIGTDVEVTLSNVRWTFAPPRGASTSATGFGTPYPAPSPVQQVFERKGTYDVRAVVTVSGRFWRDGRTATTLDSTRTTTMRHDVAEIRNLLRAS